MKFNVEWDFKSTLQQAQTEKVKVELWLRNGQKFSGKVGEVGAQNVVLAELAGREFFSALIRIDDIVAIETRV